MTSPNLHSALLRPAVLQILKATGFNYTRPAVLDTLTDLAARYLLLLASSTAQNSFNNHNSYVTTIQDVRLALSEAGALRPQLSVLEEASKGLQEVNGEMVPFEDLRGIDDFVSWAQGHANKEIRRVAGFGIDVDVGEIAAELDEQEDYLTALKKKHSKTGEESRYQGTVIGKDADAQSVTILGGPVASISDWGVQVRLMSRSRSRSRSRTMSLHEEVEGATPATATSEISSVHLSPKEAGTKRRSAAVHVEMAQ